MDPWNVIKMYVVKQYYFLLAITKMAAVARPKDSPRLSENGTE
jgi:hypothetical protein